MSAAGECQDHGLGVVGELAVLDGGVEDSAQDGLGVSNLGRWSDLVGSGDVRGLRRVMTGLDSDSIGMREVSPLGGLLPQDDRRQTMASLGR